MQKKKKTVNPESKQLLAELEDVVQRLGYKLRYEKGDFEGGYCLLKESRLFVINSKNEIERRIGIISKNLKEIGIDEIFIKPNVRDAIERESAKTKIPDEEPEEENDEETGDGEDAG
jgi:hypothetical protein